MGTEEGEGGAEEADEGEVKEARGVAGLVGLKMIGVVGLTSFILCGDGEKKEGWVFRVWDGPNDMMCVGLVEVELLYVV